MTELLSSNEIESMVDDLSFKERKKAINKDSTALVKSNDVEKIIDESALETVEAILSAKKHDDKHKKWLKFHLLRMFNVPTQLSAKIAGYHENYGYRLLNKYRNQPKIRESLKRFINDLPDDYRNVCALRLPQVAAIEGKVLQKYEKDPKLAIDKPQLLKQIKQGAGIDLHEGQTPTVGTININVAKQIQTMIKQDMESK